MKIIEKDEELSLTQKLKLIFNSGDIDLLKKDKINMNVYNNVKDIEPFVPTEKDMEFLNAIVKTDEYEEKIEPLNVESPTDEQFIQAIQSQSKRDE